MINKIRQTLIKRSGLDKNPNDVIKICYFESDETMDFWGENPDDHAIYNLTFHHDGTHCEIGGIFSFASTTLKHIVQSNLY